METPLWSLCSGSVTRVERFGDQMQSLPQMCCWGLGKDRRKSKGSESHSFVGISVRCHLEQNPMLHSQAKWNELEQGKC
jgi:hypothetical protein